MSNPVIRNILAVIAGIFIGSIVNMGIIMLLGELILPPEGVVVTDMQSLSESMHLFQPKHFAAPFLAHALGVVVGAFIAAKLSLSKHMFMAMIVGVLFLIGGIINVVLLPSPIWFNSLDLIAAYIPMAWIGWKFSNK